MISATIEDLVYRASRHAMNEMGTAIEGLDELSGALRSGVDGKECGLELNAGLGWTKDLLDLSAILHALAEQRGLREQDELSTVLEEFSALLSGVIEAQQHTDPLLLADILEYGLKPFLLSEVFPQLQGMTALLFPGYPSHLVA